MSPDTWLGVFIGGLIMTGVWGIAGLVLIAVLGTNRKHEHATPGLTETDLNRLLGRRDIPDDQS